MSRLRLSILLVSVLPGCSALDEGGAGAAAALSEAGTDAAVLTEAASSASPTEPADASSAGGADADATGEPDAAMVLCPTVPKMVAHPGETWMDGCDTLLCLADGGVERTLGDCAGICEINRYTFAPGDAVPCTDGCNTCTCAVGGVWGSTTLLCGALPKLEVCAPRVSGVAAQVQASLRYLKDERLGLTVFDYATCPAQTYRLCTESALELDASGVHAIANLRVEAVTPTNVSCGGQSTSQHTFDLRPLDGLYHTQVGPGTSSILLWFHERGVYEANSFYQVEASP